MKIDVQRGDVVEVDFGRGVGSEQGGIRPAIVTMNEKGAECSPIIKVVPLTSSIKKEFMPTHGVVLRSQAPCLAYDSMFLAEQSRPVDRTRIKKKLGCVIDHRVMAAVDVGIAVSYGMAMAYLRATLNVPA